MKNKLNTYSSKFFEPKIIFLDAEAGDGYIDSKILFDKLFFLFKLVEVVNFQYKFYTHII